LRQYALVFGINAGADAPTGATQFFLRPMQGHSTAS
jgi:hypothetical protein